MARNNNPRNTSDALADDERERAAWRRLNDIQNELGSIVAASPNRLTPSTLRATWEQKTKLDLFQTLTNIWEANEGLRRRETDPKNFSNRIVAMAAIGQTVSY